VTVENMKPAIQSKISDFAGMSGKREIRREAQIQGKPDAVLVEHNECEGGTQEPGVL
jgi:hypothetical protein